MIIGRRPTRSESAPQPISMTSATACASRLATKALCASMPREEIANDGAKVAHT